MRIGVVGVGVVGKAVASCYVAEGHEVICYDKAQHDTAILDRLTELAELVFVCVGTPNDPETGMLDCSEVFAAVDAISGQKTVVIKSTVMPGTTDAVAEKHPEHRIFFVPEFLDADTAVEDYAHPRRSSVVGYTRSKVLGHAAVALAPGESSCYWLLQARQAEMLKLATNAFYAIKVAFANQMADLGMEQDTLDALAEDPRIGCSHFKVDHKGYRGFGGHCLPKDTTALASLFADMKSRCLALPQVALEYNDLLQGGGNGKAQDD